MEKVSNYEIMKETGKKIVKGVLLPVKLFYAFPTFMNDIKSNSKVWDFKEAIVISSFFSTVAFPFLAGGVNQLFHPYETNANPFLTAAGICLATNAVSGVYEVYKHTKNKMQREVGLEKKCELFKIR